MKKTIKKLFIVVTLLFVMFTAINFNKVVNASGTEIIEAPDNVELFTIVEQAVNNGATKIQVNVSGTLNYETGSSHNSDKLTRLGTIEELTIIGTSTNAKFVQTGVGVEGMSVSGGKLIFKNITIEDTTVYSSENGESAWEFCYAEYNGNVEFYNCSIRGEYGGIMTNGNAKFTDCEFIGEKNGHGGVEYAVWINNGSATFENCKFIGNRAVKVHEDYGSDVISLNINNCEFVQITQKPGIAIGTLGEGTVVTVTNSKFYGCQPGDNGLYIYESDTDISKFTLNLENNAISEHILKLVPEVEPTYTAEGYMLYWICGDCEEWFNDPNGTSVIEDKDSLIIPKLVEVNNGKAEVTTNAIIEAIDNSNTDTVVLPLQKTQQSINTIQLPVVSIEEIVNINKSLTIETGNIEVSFDNAALKTIVNSSASNTDIILEVVEIEKEALNDNQKEAIASKEITTIISAELLCNGQQISDFEGGKVTIRIPFTPAEGTNGTDYKILYIANDGSIEEINTTYENGFLIGELEHFSKYVIAKTETSTNQKPAGNVNNNSNGVNNNQNNNNGNSSSETTDKTTSSTVDTSKTTESTQSSSSPKTGDTSNIEFWILMLIVSITGLVITHTYFKRKINKN